MDVSSSSPLPVEATIGERYRLLHKLGSGAHGTVYEASHVHLDRRFAIKVFGPPDEERQGQGRFEREARLLSRLSHENIVAVIDAGVDSVRGQYLVLELIEGRTLRAELQATNKLGLARAYEVTRQVALGLTYAHQRGVIHRDLKPENIMLSTHLDGRLLVKVLDFGIARLVEPGVDAITRSGIALGTAAYMAPEQARGERVLDERVDVFALGVVAYELITGFRPFDGESYNETLFRITTQPHVPIANYLPDVSVSLERVFERVLTKDKTQRYASVQEFVTAFQAAIAPGSSNSSLHRPENAAFADTLEVPSIVPLAGEASNAVAEYTNRAPEMSHRALLWLVASVFAAAIGVWLWTRPPSEFSVSEPPLAASEVSFSSGLGAAQAANPGLASSAVQAVALGVSANSDTPAAVVSELQPLAVEALASSGAGRGRPPGPRPRPRRPVGDTDEKLAAAEGVVAGTPATAGTPVTIGTPQDMAAVPATSSSPKAPGYVLDNPY